MDSAEIAARNAVSESVKNLAEVLRLRSGSDSEIAEMVEQALADAGLKNMEVVC